MHTKGKIEIKEPYYDHELEPEQISHILYTTISLVHTKAIAMLYNYDEESRANAHHITSLWNAADGMTTEQAIAALKIFKSIGKTLPADLGCDEAVRYLEHGREMVELLGFAFRQFMEDPITGEPINEGKFRDIFNLLAKLESK